MIKNHPDSERGNTLPPHRLLFAEYYPNILPHYKFGSPLLRIDNVFKTLIFCCDCEPESAEAVASSTSIRMFIFS